MNHIVGHRHALTGIHVFEYRLLLVRANFHEVVLEACVNLFSVDDLLQGIGILCTPKMVDAPETNRTMDCERTPDRRK